MATVAAASAAAVAALQPIPSDAMRMPRLDVYAPIMVHYGSASDADWNLVALLGQLRGAVAARDVDRIGSILSDDLMVADCDNDATRPCPLTKPGIANGRSGATPQQRLLQSLCCADMRPRDVSPTMRVDAVVEVLETALAGDTLGPDPDMAGTVCAPAQPLFDRGEAAKMAVAADTDPQNLRIAVRTVVLRKAPKADAPEGGRIGQGHMVPMVTDLPKPLPEGWSAAAMPDGTLGYTNARDLGDLVVTSVCFVKNPAGEWRIRTVIRRHAWGGPG